jgi:hypothetical protein
MLATYGWWPWLGSLLFLIIWVAIAFWPARVAGRKGHSFFGYFIFSLLFLPGGPDRRLHGLRQADGRNRVIVHRAKGVT